MAATVHVTIYPPNPAYRINLRVTGPEDPEVEAHQAFMQMTSDRIREKYWSLRAKLPTPIDKIVLSFVVSRDGGQAQGHRFVSPLKANDDRGHAQLLNHVLSRLKDYYAEEAGISWDSQR